MPRTSRVFAAVVIASAAAAACSSGTTGPTASADRPAATGTLTSGRPDVAPGESWIAFQRWVGGAEIALVRPDGSDAHSPTIDVPGTDQTNPDWSPDGLLLVFGVTSDGRDDLWTVTADGRGATLLVDCEAPCLTVDDPAWSPDGRSILFSRSTDIDGKPVSTLEVVALADGRTEVLLMASPTDFFAGQRWSPDGRAVVLEVVHREGTEPDADIVGVTLTVADLGAEEPVLRELTDPTLFAATADWSPDGGEIVYSALVEAGATTADLFAVRPDGTGLRRLTTLADIGGSAVEPDVTPDGDRIVFVAQMQAGGPSVLAAIPLSGGEPASATGSTFIEGNHPRVRPTP